MKKLKPGQYWRDTVKPMVVLKVLSTSMETIHTEKPASINEAVSINEAKGVLTEYVRCACYIRGELFGTEEMKSSRLDGERFKKVGWIRSYFLRRKLK